MKSNSNQLKTFIESLPSAVALLDRELNYIACSHQWRNDFHLVSKTVHGKSFFELFSSFPLNWKKEFQGVLTSEVVKNYSKESLKTVEGKEVHIKWDVRPWYQEDKAVGGLIVTIELVQEGNLESEVIALKERNEFLEGINENSSYAIITTRADGIITSFNRAAEEILGYKRGDLIGKESPAIFHDLSEVAARSVEFSVKLGVEIEPGFETFTCMTDRGYPNEYEWTYIAQNGRIFPVILRISAIRNDKNEIIGYIGMANDISKEKQKEREIIEARKYLEIALEGADLGVWDWYLKTNEVLFDKGWAKMLGYSIEEIEMNLSTWKDKVHPEDIGKCYEDIQAYLDGRVGKYENIHRMKHKNGSWVYILDRGKISEWDETGNPVKFTGTHLDITKEINKEHEILKARDEALRANELKSQFLANMSHEIRTPMNGILGMVELLAETPLNPDQREMIETIDYCGDTLIAILNDILDVSKLGAGEISLENVSFDIDELLTYIEKLYSPKAKQKGIELIFEKSKFKHVLYKGDPHRIKQILFNLVSNAIKFTETGSVTVSISVQDLSSTKDKLTIEVKDTGDGIASENQRDIFLSFTQADNSITRKFGGTGLGLYICSQLAKLMGSEIHIHSEEGRGSIFSFSLELEREAFLAQEGLDEKHREFSLNVLVVEDNEINQKLIVKILKKHGITPDIASNGKEAVTKVLKGQFDLVFMDMQMPIMDGISATTKILENLGESAPPIIAMTANAFEEDRKRCREAGMKGFIAKPFEKKMILETLQKYSSEAIKKKTG